MPKVRFRPKLRNLVSVIHCSAWINSNSPGLDLEFLDGVDVDCVGGVEGDLPGSVVAGHKLVERGQFRERDLVLDEGEPNPDAVTGTLAESQELHYVPVSFGLLCAIVMF